MVSKKCYIRYMISRNTKDKLKAKYAPIGGAPLSDLLTPVQMTYAKCIAEGMSNSEIATQLNVSEAFVRQKLSMLYDILGITGEGPSLRVQLAVRYDRWARVAAAKKTLKYMFSEITQVVDLDNFIRVVSACR